MICPQERPPHTGFVSSIAHDAGLNILILLLNMFSFVILVNTYFCAFLRGLEGKREELDMAGDYFQWPDIVFNHN